jgi:hypothetical protein
VETFSHVPFLQHAVDEVAVGLVGGAEIHLLWDG